MVQGNKPKMDSHLLIEKMKEKGIRFDEMSESQAYKHIKDINNYLRTASYRKNYPKGQKGNMEGKYIDLDFYCLVELSKIDMYLRNHLFKMCIDVEHALKIKLISTIEDNPLEDGYNIVDMFFSKHKGILNKVEQKADTIFTGDLIDKYFTLCYVFDSADRNDFRIRITDCHCPVWVLVELLGFGDTIKLITFYNETYPQYRASIPPKNVLQPISSLRNACAHNNCILNNMAPSNTKANSVISTYVASIKSIGTEERKKKLSSRPLFEMVCLIKCYGDVVSDNVKTNGLKQLSEFVNGRMVIHGKHFKSNQLITTSYNFLKKVLDNSL